MTKTKSDQLFDFHSIELALETGQRHCHKIVMVAGKSGQRWITLRDQAQRKGIRLETLSADVFRKQYGAQAKQGIAGHFSPIEPLSLSELVDQAFKKDPQPVLAILDEIQDPQNLGALIRSAYALGVNGLVLPKRRSAPVNETVAKCSAGAIEFMPFAVVNNLVQAAETLKESRFWIVGSDRSGEQPCHQLSFDMPVALVIGGEEKGIRPLLRQTCDFIVSIPMAGNLDSLNASVAGAILFYEIQRQRLPNKNTPK